MKTLILSFLFIFGLTASNIGKPINDIYSVKEPIFEDETYVNDIPFDTYRIAVDAILEGNELKLEEETYINDIPFDTRAIASKCLLIRNMETSEEANTNDIPFSTEKVFYEKLAENLTQQYRNESGVNDLPDAPDYFIFSYYTGMPARVVVKFMVPGKVEENQRKTGNHDGGAIYPVKPDLPETEINNEGMNEEVIVLPGFSL